MLYNTEHTKEKVTSECNCITLLIGTQWKNIMGNSKTMEKISIKKEAGHAVEHLRAKVSNSVISQNWMSLISCTSDCLMVKLHVTPCIVRQFFYRFCKPLTTFETHVIPAIKWISGNPLRGRTEHWIDSLGAVWNSRNEKETFKTFHPLFSTKRTQLKYRSP